MIKPVLFLAITLAGVTAASAAQAPALVQLANPLMGTDNPNGFSHGNTIPEAALPFPMNAWSAYTQPQRALQRHHVGT